MLKLSILIILIFTACSTNQESYSEDVSTSQMPSDEQTLWCKSKLILYDNAIKLERKLPSDSEEETTFLNQEKALEILQAENNLSTSSIDLWFEGDQQKAAEFYEGVGAEFWDEDTNDFVPGSRFREYLLHLELENKNMLKYCKIWEEISKSTTLTTTTLPKIELEVSGNFDREFTFKEAQLCSVFYEFIAAPTGMEGWDDKTIDLWIEWHKSFDIYRELNGITDPSFIYDLGQEPWGITKENIDGFNNSFGYEGVNKESILNTYSGLLRGPLYLMMFGVEGNKELLYFHQYIMLKNNKVGSQVCMIWNEITNYGDTLDFLIEY